MILRLLGSWGPVLTATTEPPSYATAHNTEDGLTVYAYLSKVKSLVELNGIVPIKFCFHC